MADPNPFQPPSAELEGPAGVSTSTATGATERMIAELKGTQPWVRFLAILGFITSGLMLVGGIALVGMSVFLKQNEGIAAMAGMSLFYLAIGGLYFVGSYKLHAYGEAILKVVAVRSAATVELALGKQRSFWKLMGILTIVGLVVGVLVMIAAVVVAVVGATKLS